MRFFCFCVSLNRYRAIRRAGCACALSPSTLCCSREVCLGPSWTRDAGPIATHKTVVIMRSCQAMNA